MCVGVCVLGATSVHTARGSLVASQSHQRNWPRPPALYNNRKGNGLPKASSFRQIVLPALAQSCHETINSIYQPYIHHQCYGRSEGGREEAIWTDVDNWRERLWSLEHLVSVYSFKSFLSLFFYFIFLFFFTVFCKFKWGLVALRWIQTQNHPTGYALCKKLKI